MAEEALDSLTRDILQAAPSFPAELLTLMTRAVGADQPGGLGEMALLTLGTLAAAMILETAGGRRLSQIRAKIRAQDATQFGITLFYAVLRVLLSAFEILLFMAGAKLVIGFGLDQGDPRGTTLNVLVNAVVVFRLVRILLRALLSPYAAKIRPVNLSDETAQATYRGLSLFVAVYVFADTIGFLIKSMDASRELAIVAPIVVSLPVLFFLIGFAWGVRETIDQLFFGDAPTEDSNPALQITRQVWPHVYTGWILMVFVFWADAIVTGNRDLLHATNLMWWLTLTFPFLDRTLYALLRQLHKVRFLQREGYKARMERFQNIVQNGGRILLALLVVIAMIDAFVIADDAVVDEVIAGKALSAAIDIALTLMVAYVIWELSAAALDQHIPDEAEEDQEGEGGGAGATRKETLAPLLRSAILVLLSVTSVLSVLHAVGVQIAPLIAGAGVVGIAVGFGAQKLVQDVLSGVFFLLDDAFRKGEYIEAGGMKGSVEKINLRSMRLRHHLGPVQTLPYSEIASVKNMSRDWVTMKLELRLPFDSDVEVVRKLIKKVGQDLLEDPDIGADILQPLKSQGVTRIEESALIFRMKFTTLPGKQWVVRREAYRRVKDALEEKGISFAHREVRVFNEGPATEGAAAGSIDPAIAPPGPAGEDR